MLANADDEYEYIYTPNRRGIKNGWAHRNILTAFPYGFIEGLTKVTLSGKQDCFESSY